MRNEEPQKFTRMRHRRGAGSVFQKPGSPHWVIQYYRFDPDKGKSVRVREYTRLSSRSEAQKLLTDRLGKIGRGEPVAPGRPVTVAELYDALRTFTENNSVSPRAATGLGWRWKHLAPFFAGMRAANVTTAAVEKYKRQRKAEGAAPATVNRELATLRRAFNYGKRSTPPRVFSVPYIQMFPENNARQGFVEEAAFQRMTAEASLEGLWLRALLEVAYSYGWRRGELINLRVRQVDLINGTIRLDPGTTKNGEGREVAMTLEVEQLLRAAIDGKKPADWVFTRDDGKPVKDFRGAWRNLCVRAGTAHWECRKCNAVLTSVRCECGGTRKYVGLIPHDFRRSAAKALRRAGVPESVIMAMGDGRHLRCSAAMPSLVALINGPPSKLLAEKALSPPFGPPGQETQHIGEEKERSIIQ